MVDPIELARVDAALVLLHFGYRRIVDEPDRILGQRGLGRVHHRLLFFLARNPDVSVGELCALLDVTKQALHRPLQQLVASELVTSHDGADRRVKQLRLTRKGIALEARLTGVQQKLLARAFAAAGPGGETGWRDVMKALGEKT